VIIEWVLAASALHICGWLAPGCRLAVALSDALDATPPFQTVEDLADHRGECSRGYFKAWKETFATDTSFADVMDWHLLLRTLAVKVPHQGWTEACRITHTTQPRIKRIAERLVGIDLNTLEHGEPLLAIAGFCAVSSALTRGYSAAQVISRIG
jgi:hypothetical protein